MDVQDLLSMDSPCEKTVIRVSGWLVDWKDGLYLLGDHFPEDYDYPFRIKISNSNVIYAILQEVPTLGGGRSLLFYRAKMLCVVNSVDPWLIDVHAIEIEASRESGRYVKIDIDPKMLVELVKNNGDYDFNRRGRLFNDWIVD
jgi:hypothetical protein